MEQAENFLKSGLGTYPHYAAARVLLGEILISKGEYEQAARFVGKALEITPWNISGQRFLAECHRKLGDEDAMQVARRAAEMFEADEATPQSMATGSGVENSPFVGPEGELSEVATPALADLYMIQGHLEKAQDVYERLLESAPDKVEWNERLAAIRAQISQDENLDAPTGYPGAGENLDLIAGEVKGEADVPGAARTNVVTSEEMKPDEIDAEASSPELEVSVGDSRLAGKASQVDVKERESGVGPEEVVGGNAVDSILQNMIQLYIQEENDAQALDMCRKAQILGENAPWIVEKILVLQQKMEESTALSLRHEAEKDKDRSSPVISHKDQKVVRTLESWLETLQRRKANA